jgi:hypothetical protein
VIEVIDVKQVLDKYSDLIMYAGIFVLIVAAASIAVFIPRQPIEQPFLNGVLNVGFFGVPLYGWIIGAVALILATMEFAFQYFYWKPMEYVRGIWAANKAESKAVFVGDMKNRFEIYDEAKAKLVHPHEEYTPLYKAFFAGTDKAVMARLHKLSGKNLDMKIAQHMEGDEYLPDKSLTTVGGNETDLVIDLGEWTFPNSAAHKEVIRIVNLWNDIHVTGNEETDDGIYSYAKLSYYIFTGKFDIPFNERILKPTVMVPWSRVKAAFPPQESEASYAGFERQRAKEMQDESAQLNEYTTWMIAMTVVIAIILLGMRAMHFIGHGA